MKKLEQIDFGKFELSNLLQIRGGDGTTTYYRKGKKAGTDCYSDDDNSGNLNTGDSILLDTGVWIVKR